MTVSTRDWEAFASPSVADGSLRMDFVLDGIHCASCVSKIEKGLVRLDGVIHARLNVSSQRLSVEWQQEETDADTIIEVLNAMGYKAYPFDPTVVHGNKDEVSSELLKSMAVAGFASMNVMLLSVSVWSGNATSIDIETRSFFHWISALIALPAAAYSGLPFFRSSYRAIKSRTVNMDVPISIGVVLALALSLFQTMQHAAHVYFDSAIMLLFFLLVGRYLDHNMRRRTRSFAENLAALRADTAMKELPDGTVKQVPLSRIDPGDIVSIAPGDRISVDGIVLSGISEIDQSLITGETALSPIGEGETVYAGTLNVAGKLRVQATAATQGTLLDEVNRLLESAAQSRSKYVRLADKVAGYYAPIVHGAAGLTFLGWLLLGGDWQFALVTAISVLIITCPCALGLAIPAVQVVASGQLFRSGILLNAGDAIERLAGVDTIVFDKTGTLTKAEPELVESQNIPEKALFRAGKLALSSRHPLANALANRTENQQPYDSVTEKSGSGVETMQGGRVLRLGSPSFCGVEKEKIAKHLGNHPSASVIVYREGDGEPTVFLVEQALRSDAIDVISTLKEAGYKVAILSGDREPAVREVAETVGISAYVSELQPQDKIEKLEKLKSAGQHVLMVGDGLNDAPALACANVSLSPVTAVELTQASADGVFLSEKLFPVVQAIRTSRLAKRTMMQNLLLSTIYNIVAVPIAVAGLVTPLIAALAMSGSSILVIANALKLRLSERALANPEVE